MNLYKIIVIGDIFEKEFKITFVAKSDIKLNTIQTQSLYSGWFCTSHTYEESVIIIDMDFKNTNSYLMYDKLYKFAIIKIRNVKLNELL